MELSERLMELASMAPKSRIGIAVRLIAEELSKDEKRKLNQRERTRRCAAKAIGKHKPNVSLTSGSLSKEISPTPPKENTSTSLTFTSLRSVKDGEPSIRDQLFGKEGAGWLSTFTGKPLSGTKGLIGKWLRDAKDDARQVLLAIQKSREDQIADPIAWISASLKPNKTMKSREKINATIEACFPQPPTR